MLLDFHEHRLLGMVSIIGTDNSPYRGVYAVLLPYLLLDKGSHAIFPTVTTKHIPLFHEKTLFHLEPSEVCENYLFLDSSLMGR